MISPLSDVTKEDISVISAARYMNSTSDHSPLGIIVVNLHQKFLNSVIDNASILPNSVSLVLDEDGTLMAVSDAELFAQYGLSSKLIFDKISHGENAHS